MVFFLTYGFSKLCQKGLLNQLAMKTKTLPFLGRLKMVISVKCLIQICTDLHVCAKKPVEVDYHISSQYVPVSELYSCNRFNPFKHFTYHFRTMNCLFFHLFKPSQPPKQDSAHEEIKSQAQMHHHTNWARHTKVCVHERIRAMLPDLLVNIPKDL